MKDETKTYSAYVGQSYPAGSYFVPPYLNFRIRDPNRPRIVRTKLSRPVKF